MVPCVCIPMCYHPYSLNIIGIPTCHLILNMACQLACEWLNKLRNLTRIWSSIQWRKTCRSVRTLRWMSQARRGYVQAIRTPCANVPKVGLFS
ncbi:hypothetical protein AAG906_007809 [Vitis piasezkii]